MSLTHQQHVSFVLPTVGQPRHAKRIAMLDTQGFTVSALTFERDYHTGRMPDCPIESLGKITKGQYFKRLFTLVRVIPALRKKTAHVDAIYAFGLDLTTLVLLANVGRKKPVIFEVGDIRPVQVKSGISGLIMRIISQLVYRQSSLLVVTAADFVTGYYSKQSIPKTPFLVIENKMEATVESIDIATPEASVEQENEVATGKAHKSLDPNKSTDTIKIGYYGLLRSAWSYKILQQYAQDNPDSVSIVIAGAVQEGHEDFEQLIVENNVKYLGPYRSPDDLANLYGQVDLVWACYPEPAAKGDAYDSGWAWAQAVCRSNRFYESCFYQVPIISMRHSSDGKIVNQMNIGLVLESYEYPVIKQCLDNITEHDRSHWKKNLKELPSSIFQYTDEDSQLANAIVQSIKTRMLTR